MEVVESEEGRAAGGEIEFGDGGVVEAEPAEAVQVELDEFADGGDETEVVGDDGDLGVGVALDDFFEGAGGPGLESAEGLASGHGDVGGGGHPFFEQFGVIGEEVFESLSLDLALVQLAESGFRADVEAVRLGDDLGGLAGADEVGGINGGEGRGLEGEGEGRGLVFTGFGQGDIGEALASSLLVPDGLAVSDQYESGGHG